MPSYNASPVFPANKEFGIWTAPICHKETGSTTTIFGTRDSVASTVATSSYGSSRTNSSCSLPDLNEIFGHIRDPAYISFAPCASNQRESTYEVIQESMCESIQESPSLCNSSVPTVASLTGSVDQLESPSFTGSLPKTSYKVSLKNIPGNYTRKQVIDTFIPGLPTKSVTVFYCQDKTTKTSSGYANFTFNNLLDASEFVHKFDGLLIQTNQGYQNLKASFLPSFVKGQ